ncbi:MAG: hypothetical protein ABI779_11330, partial [Acidobacteriota bacterium]
SSSSAASRDARALYTTVFTWLLVAGCWLLVERFAWPVLPSDAGSLPRPPETPDNQQPATVSDIVPAMRRNGLIAFATILLVDRNLRAKIPNS